VDCLERLVQRATVPKGRFEQVREDLHDLNAEFRWEGFVLEDVRHFAPRPTLPLREQI
jgi:hypothetical protein